MAVTKRINHGQHYYIVYRSVVLARNSIYDILSGILSKVFRFIVRTFVL